MATLNQEGAGELAELRSAADLPRLRWTQLLAISIFALAFSFHWGALGLIILPSQVLKMVGDANKGAALAVVLVPGAFIALFSNPMFGWLSDRTGGRLAVWGRRRPYIFVGTLVNIAALIWLAAARDIPSLAVAYALTQFSSNAAQAPFHALLPDIVPAEQRGLTSGMIGLLGTLGQIGGVLIAGIFIDASKPLAAYQQGVWLTYGIISFVMIVLMLVTVFSVQDSSRVVEQTLSESKDSEDVNTIIQSDRALTSLMPPMLVTIAGTLIAILAAWGLMALWNTLHIAGLQLDGTVQQVVLELFATIGILRIFDFNPRRDPDFAWVLATRMVMMLGIYTIQTFLQFYMRDAVGVAHPEQATTNFVILVSVTALVSAFAAGWLSDHFGRKRMVYFAGFMMALVGLIFVLTHSYVLVLASGALFGLGYGAYTSVDWALVVDVLPSKETFARDMGVWNIALSVPQVVAPVLGGPIIDAFTQAHQAVLGYQVLFCMAIIYCVIGTITVRFIRGVKA